MIDRQRHFALLLVFILCVSCSPRDRAEGAPILSSDSVPSLGDLRCVNHDRSKPCALFGVSIYELITRPREWHGKHVRVVGYADLHEEGSHLYASSSDWRRNIAANAIGMVMAAAWPDSLNGRDILVEATFDAHSGGSLQMITRFESWESMRTLRSEEIPEIDLRRPVR